MSHLLKKQSMSVSTKNENVILTIGNVSLPMHFSHAFDLSKWIREKAASIKSVMNRARTIRSLGTLDTRPQFTPNANGGIHVKSKLNSWSEDDVTIEGRLICIQIKNKIIRLHFENALTISQWLRVRAKEAQRCVGDLRHWSKV